MGRMMRPLIIAKTNHLSIRLQDSAADQYLMFFNALLV